MTARRIRVTGYIPADSLEASDLDPEHVTGLSESGHSAISVGERLYELSDLEDLELTAVES